MLRSNSCFGKFLFWKDRCIGDTPLQVRFPTLYSPESRKSCYIKDHIGSNGYVWEWKHSLNDQSYVNELCDLLHLISSTHSTNNPDALKCKISPDATFSVHSIRHWIDEKLTTGGFSDMVWNKAAPLKVNCFIWRAGLGRIPVAKCLRDRGVLSIPSVCNVCDREEEDIEHALISCSRSVEIRRWIFSWCCLTLPHFSSVLDLIQFAANWGNCPKKRKVLLKIIYCMIWHT